MGKITMSQEAFETIVQVKESADKRLQESPTQKFERNFSNILQEEIARGLSAAESFKHMMRGTNSYTYTHIFPLPICEELSEDTLLMLEKASIYLTKNKELGTANIRIVYHF